MGDLRDQLKKAKLMSGKDAKRLAHQERVERKEKGREELEKEHAERERELAAKRGAVRAKNRQQQALLEEQRKQREEEAACRDILAEARKPGPGTVQWFFQTVDGWLPWLEVSPQEVNQLRSGMLSVVRTGAPGTHSYKLLSTELARRVAKLFPDAVVHAPKGVL